LVEKRSKTPLPPLGGRYLLVAAGSFRFLYAAENDL